MLLKLLTNLDSKVLLKMTVRKILNEGPCFKMIILVFIPRFCRHWDV